MKKELKSRWVTALRSGEYKQGRRNLRLNNEFCCLGVLCEIDERVIRGSYDTYSYKGVPNMSWVLSNEYLDDLRLPHEQTSLLMGMNDNKGESFSEIANWIEANVEVTT